MDARNHGDSPHCQDMDYDLLSDDVLALMQDLRIKTASLVGHSMGGRTMMAVAMKNVFLESKTNIYCPPTNHCYYLL